MSSRPLGPIAPLVSTLASKMPWRALARRRRARQFAATGYVYRGRQTPDGPEMILVAPPRGNRRSAHATSKKR